MIKIVFEAIVARFDSSSGSALRTLVNGMFITGVDIPVDTPFITFGLPASATDNTFDALHDIVDIQFDIWDDEPSPEKAADIEAELNTLYDDFLLLTGGGFTTYRVDRVFTQLLDDPDKAWHIAIGYQYKMAC